MRTPQRLALALLAASLLTTACGARLTDDQLAQARTSGGSGGAVVPGLGGVDGDGLLDDELMFEDGGEPVEADAGGTTGDAAAGTSGGGGGAEGTTGGGGGGATGGGTTGGGGGGTGGAAPTDTRAAPPGGNGGATDKGVTADEIVIYNAADIGGAVPGLFEDAQFAVKAYVAMFNATEGTIYGRKLRLLALDSRLDAGANRSVSIQACDQAFAGVGSLSAFDQGAAPVLRDCGIPDLRALATTDQMKDIPNVFGIDAAGKPGQRNMGVYGWPAKKFPEAVKKAAFLYSDGEVTRQLAEQDIKGAEAAHGYKFEYVAGIGTTETNYAPFVQQLKSRGIRYVTFVGSYQQAARLAQTMQQQGVKPDAYIPTVTSYTPDFIRLGGAATEGTYVAVASSLVEEIGANKELQLYAQWLNQVEPGASPTGIGQYAWSAARLFVEKAKKIGPQLTREKMNAELRSVRAYDGGGLFANRDVGGKTITDCTSFVQVRGGKFVRVEPAAPRQFRCNDGIFDTRENRIVKRG